MDRLARGVSTALHPMVALTAWAVALVILHRSWIGPDAVLWVMLVLVPGTVLAIGVRLGIWSDLDMSDLRERRMALPAAAGLAVGVAVWSVVGVFPPLLRFCAVAIAIWLVVTAAVSLEWKISMHEGAAAGLVLIAALGLGAGVAAALVWVPFAVAWARIRLRKHTPMQVAAGAMAAVVSVALARLWLVP